MTSFDRGGSTPAGFDRARVASLLAEERSRFAASHPRSAALAEEAAEHLLAGVPMAWMTRWPGSFPLFMASASGGHLTDVDGLDYVDFALGDTGAMCGHALPQVTEALAAQAARGITTMLPSADAIWVAAELARRFGLPRWQLAMTATDANRFALRLARYLTGRPKVVVFDWCYHGTVDETLANLDGEGRTVAREWNIGAPVDPALTTVVVPFNDIGAVEAALASGDVACVLAEPALTNIGIVLPAARVPRGPPSRMLGDRHAARHRRDPHDLRRSRRGHGRLGPAARPPDHRQADRRRHARGGVRHDCRRSPSGLSSLMAAEGVDVSGIGGTLTGNALAVAAMKATLSSALRDEDFAVAIPLASRWADGVASVIEAHGLPWTVQRLGCRAEYWFCPAPADGTAAALAVDPELEAFLHLFALNRGVMLTPFHNMALLSSAHTTADVDRHTDVFARVHRRPDRLTPGSHRRRRRAPTAKSCRSSHL